MTRLPEDISSEGDTTIDGLFGLDERIRQKLSSINVERIFAVQAEAWQRTGGGIGFHRDVCIQRRPVVVRPWHTLYRLSTHWPSKLECPS